MSKYEFKDLFDADKNLTKKGKTNRASVIVWALTTLEQMYPSK